VTLDKSNYGIKFDQRSRPLASENKNVWNESF